MLADTGYDGQAVQEGDWIPPERRHGIISDPARQAIADLVAAASLDGAFGQ